MEDWPETVREIHSVLQICGVLAGQDTRQVGNILPSYFTYVLYKKIRVAYGHPLSRSCGGLEGPFLK